MTARNYRVSVRGPVPPDLAERIARMHAAALLELEDQEQPEPEDRHAGVEDAAAVSA